MKAIILAAGQGTRLRPLTDKCPKAMVKLHNKSLLDYQIEQFHRAGIQDIAVITGYKREAVTTEHAIKLYTNERFAETNMVYTLFCAQDELQEDVIVSYGDIFYSEPALQKLMSSESDISVVVDTQWKSYYAERFGNPYDDAESLVLNEAGQIRSIGQSQPLLENIQAQYIGLMRFKQRGLEQIKGIFHESMQSDAPIGWGRAAEKAYMTDLLQEAIHRGFDIQAVPIDGGWFEIDSLHDYEVALKCMDKSELWKKAK
ncbi:phosphocholine cytidylyltransferase family protein [Paenibacillus hexagrammi]|uniref:Phosphocholine cytidylyltransferase family protein n=1 Tax=Paenibacillus hexagrammi TaxID=2908839 RepID=A0ABY3SI86_9BACL|nr:phosphocholine cytidylyltransferase family protein [Paenibacillus sp. YPD9-1]UJF33208.1 phosphocholine cytidylyltransferase family protein [Paenibacillus sp. YPD9-1]